MQRLKYNLLQRRSTQRSLAISRETLEQLKRDISVSRSKAHPNIEDRIIQDIKQKHREWIRSAALDTSQVDPGYRILITDDSVENPLVITSELVRIIRAATRDAPSKESKARRIYDWIEQSIEYGKIDGRKGYIDSQEVLSYRRGICAEMAFLYIAMARSVGLRSNFVSVSKDYRGKKVNHACAVVETERGLVFVDPAYHKYDVKHQKYEIWNDKEIIGMFEKLRGR
ncbi:MAG: hypothetical protein KKC75_08370 [Nanoarchaeota archaeon]|nr:hypothetical protein [Nanoarchaeota archaeon]MBU1004486.1 hypothetical protein [Nanoarchaeota archaeon]MBU1945656.1 hypothetical protein [Nanoarchaeota archaeon]